MISKRYKYDPKSILKLNNIQLNAKKEIEKKINSGHYNFKHINCQICAQGKFETLAEKDRYGLQHKTVICKNCGLVYSNPQMSLGSYIEFYESEYRNLYVGTQRPTELFFKRQVKKGKSIYKFINCAVSNFIKNKTKVLEIGCGAGGILHYFKQKGCIEKGIDLGGEYLLFGKKNYNLDLVKGSIQNLVLDFIPDIIIYSHVLEHITDLNSELNYIKDLMSPNSILYIEVPGIKMIYKNYKMNFLLYLQNAHTFCFSLTSLNNLMLKNQFKLVSGNENVQSLYIKNNFKSNSKNINDFEHVIKYLTVTETFRVLYPLSINNIKAKTVKLLILLLDFFRLKNTISKLITKLYPMN